MKKPKRFSEVIREAARLSREFARIDPRPWPPEIKALDLQNKVGNIARLVLEQEGFKPSSSKKQKLAEELALVFFIGVDLADTYHLDLERAVSALFRATSRHLKAETKKRRSKK